MDGSRLTVYVTVVKEHKLIMADTNYYCSQINNAGHQYKECYAC